MDSLFFRLVSVKQYFDVHDFVQPVKKFIDDQTIFFPSPEDSQMARFFLKKGEIVDKGLLWPYVPST